MSANFTTFGDHVFKAGGDEYFPLPVDVIAKLPPFYRAAALEVGAALMILAGREGNFDPASAEIAALLPSDRGQAEGSPPGHRSISFVQKGLAILDLPDVDEETGEVLRPGLGLIRRARCHGRRLITWVKGLKPGRGRGKVPADAPLCTPPPGGEKEGETTTTRDASSSSSAPLPGSGPGRADGPGLPPELEAAIDLVPGLSRERLLGWYRLHPELARRAVAWLRIWLCHRNPEKRPKGPTWAEKALLSWKARIERGELTLADIDQDIEAKRQQWGGRDPEVVAQRDAAKAAEKAGKAKSEAEAAAAEGAREDRLRASWGLLGEAGREEIRAEVKAANPFVRWDNLLEPLYLAELERRLAAEPHRRE